MILKKQEAIKYHREMWNWIAEQYENGSEEHIEVLKDKFIELKHHNYIYCDCYCCEYADNESLINTHDHRCYSCPVVWGNEKEANEYYKTKVTPLDKPYYCMGYSNLDGLFGKIRDLTESYIVELKRKEVVELAKQIANLEERIDV